MKVYEIPPRKEWGLGVAVYPCRHAWWTSVTHTPLQTYISYRKCAIKPSCVSAYTLWPLWSCRAAGLQGCRAWLLRRSQFCSYIPCGPCEDCLAFMGHSIFGGQYSLELLRLSRELSQGSAVWGLRACGGLNNLPGAYLSSGAEDPGEELASKAAVSPPVSFHWGTGLPQRCVVPSFSPPMTYDSRELSGLFHLFLRKS